MGWIYRTEMTNCVSEEDGRRRRGKVEREMSRWRHRWSRQGQRVQLRCYANCGLRVADDFPIERADYLKVSVEAGYSRRNAVTGWMRKARRAGI